MNFSFHLNSRAYDQIQNSSIKKKKNKNLTIMTATLLTTYACGHEERSATRIGAQQEPGVMGIIRRISCKNQSRPVIADSALLCKTCREKPHPNPLRSHPVIIIRSREPKKFDEYDASPYANEFAELPKYGAHDFTRKHPNDGYRKLCRQPLIPIAFSTDDAYRAMKSSRWFRKSSGPKWSYKEKRRAGWTVSKSIPCQRIVKFQNNNKINLLEIIPEFTCKCD